MQPAPGGATKSIVDPHLLNARMLAHGNDAEIEVAVQRFCSGQRAALT
jgi:hypothetical protein